MRDFFVNWAFRVLIGADVFVRSLWPFGDPRPYQTISSTIGESIRKGGWASRVPWPAWFYQHCLSADHMAEV